MLGEKPLLLKIYEWAQRPAPRPARPPTANLGVLEGGNPELRTDIRAPAAALAR